MDHGGWVKDDWDPWLTSDESDSGCQATIGGLDSQPCLAFLWRHYGVPVTNCPVKKLLAKPIRVMLLLAQTYQST